MVDAKPKQPVGARKPRVCFVAAAALVLVGSWAAAAGAQTNDTTITGRVTVSDGDTIRFGRMRVRLWGIDAPERSQTCGSSAAGERSRAAMVRLAEGRAAVCSLRDVDRDNRPVAVCSVGGRDLGAAIVAEGWAWDFRRYSQGAYARQEAEAREARRGVHSMQCEAPWDWRERRRRESKARAR